MSEATRGSHSSLASPFLFWVYLDHWLSDARHLAKVPVPDLNPIHLDDGAIRRIDRLDELRSYLGRFIHPIAIGEDL